VTDDLQKLARDWLEFKRVEERAVEDRRRIEDRIKSLVGVADDQEGSTTAKPEGFTVRITGRIDRKVDADKVQELAAEYGLTDHLGQLFRWKPEINVTAWRAADPSITRPLADAITTKPSRASFKITQDEE
jgi:hypothetical protein